MRALTALAGGDGYCRLKRSDDGEGFVLEKVSKTHWKKVIGGDATADEEVLDELDIELEEAMGEFEVAQGPEEASVLPRPIPG